MNMSDLLDDIDRATVNNPHLDRFRAAYLVAAYYAGINPLPALRKAGYRVDYCRDGAGPCNTEIQAGEDVHRMMIVRQA